MTKGLLPYQKVIYEKGFEAGFKEGYKINFEKGFLQDSRESILDNLDRTFSCGSEFSEREDYYNH